MYDELVKRLRYAASYDERIVIQNCKEAADAIEELERENERLHDDLGKAIRWLAEEHAKQCPHYIRNVHDRGDDSLCDKFVCEVKSLPKWIPVTERLPEDQDEVLVFVSDEIGVAWRSQYGLWCSSDFGMNYLTEHEPTHWMPLPEPPEDDEA